ncbi:hypothetical protein [Paraburkholderia sp. BL23I1N1]|uniref:hypothetical protein n=1 Tax=Paraburkholderia sp. BL23I1N1 TaxID=1938802 RepID=UPI0011C3F8FE|nr:hypothetical protein [Paraburkholderia sp. BL23I1N1]
MRTVQFPIPTHLPFTRIDINNIKTPRRSLPRLIYFSSRKVKDLRFPRSPEAEIFRFPPFGKSSGAFPGKFFELLLIIRGRGHVTQMKRL